MGVRLGNTGWSYRLELELELELELGWELDHEMFSTAVKGSRVVGLKISHLEIKVV